jgi:hypothetical protein
MEQVPPADLQAHLDETTPFVVAETCLANALGLKRDDLRAARSKTVRGTDWQVRGHGVYWTEKAAYLLTSQQQPPDPSPAPCESVATPSQAPDEAENLLPQAEVLRVTAWNFPNTRVIRCISENNGHAGQDITVRVKDARLFRNGMLVLARPQPGAAWEFLGNPANPEGPRHPRWPGRW